MSEDQKPPYLSARWQGPGSPRLLIVDDDPAVRRSMVRFLTRAGFEVVSVASGTAALTLIDAGEAFDAALIDLEMPQMDGITLMKKIFVRRPQLPMGLWSGSVRLDELTPEELSLASFVKHKLVPAGEVVQAVCRVIYGSRGVAEDGGAPTNGRGGNGHDGDGGEQSGRAAPADLPDEYTNPGLAPRLALVLPLAG